MQPYPHSAAASTSHHLELAPSYLRNYSALKKPTFDFDVNDPRFHFLERELVGDADNEEASEEEASVQLIEESQRSIIPASEDGVAMQDGQDRTARTHTRPLSRQLRKARRASRPAMVLNALPSATRYLYAMGSTVRSDLSYSDPRRHPSRKSSKSPAKLSMPPAEDADALVLVSTYSILTRFLEHVNENEGMETEFQYTKWELHFLEAKGYSPASVTAWAAALTENHTVVAAKTLRLQAERTPFFVVALFLRRKYIRASALGILMQHVQYQLNSGAMNPATLEVVVIRLIRHARVVWPEAIPWITSLYVRHAFKVYNIGADGSTTSPKAIANLTFFTNKLLSLLALPASRKSLHSARDQEKAQLQVLQFMANCSPSIMVTRSGFRSVARNQLAHVKTPQEQEWARLKGSSWPPWKESRTAMDDDKGYEFGASRASRVLHRMHDAGYAGRTWEGMAEIYAGWDTDQSPTIQIRTLLPGLSSRYDDDGYLRSLTWAGRIRATRNSREAWACFLAWESSGSPAHEAIFRAMFESLHFSMTLSEPESNDRNEMSNLSKQHAAEASDETGGTQSTFYQVYLSEPIPTYIQLYGRMLQAKIKPSDRLVAFFLETCPDFTMTLSIIDAAEDSRHAITALIHGQHTNREIIRAMPGYLFKAFIEFLCRFGSLSRPPDARTSFVPSQKHSFLFRDDRHYLLEYAYALLYVYRPKYPPAWTALLCKLTKRKRADLPRKYTSHDMVFRIASNLEQLDMDIDDEIFHLLCTETLHVLQSPKGGSVSERSRTNLYKKGSSRLRTLFHNLVEPSSGSEMRLDSEDTVGTDPSHVPSPAVLHAFVRVLGCFHDYEGLYSLSTWMTKHHEKISTLAASTTLGNQILFRTLVALRGAVQGDLHKRQEHLYHGSGSPEIAQLVKAQIESVEEWGGWPDQYYVDLYVEGNLKFNMPVANKPETDWLEK